jgi:hypothetical protein
MSGGVAAGTEGATHHGLHAGAPGPDYAKAMRILYDMQQGSDVACLQDLEDFD